MSTSFIAAPNGWRLAFRDDDGSVFFDALPGWLMTVDTTDDTVVIEPMVSGNDGRMVAADLAVNLLGVFGPTVTDEQACKRIDMWRADGLIEN